jgi:hypothetical protein
LPLPNQENKNREEMRKSAHDLSWIQTCDPIVQVEKSVHALDCKTTVIGSQNNFVGMEKSATQYWPFSNGDI